ncbi:sirohydrochlorin ferrochelatase [Marchantia polymorpha subsp. ruderalis]|uniref:Sirohydrochlorin ferrochelatase, chloroplastic n=2 Tax=Marchantia polymorpha TaxID=3197 RepID=A0AAF6BNL9_MARPO|nr:hypothetical protein MARPO_0034s0026 [Marchantia polymorpha]BBN13603.1 hypothetical protein Mp_6g04910 [Marchantia polymorpha subsp. ruderalis]|eukprot:PTQ41428.1 hypothetical protein MARPO_0034s0026 [Marchantia polymorpha]
MPAQSVVLVVPVPVPGPSFRRGAEACGALGSAKPCLGFSSSSGSRSSSSHVSARDLSSFRFSSFHDLLLPRRPRAKRPTMGGGGVTPLPASGTPVQSKLGDGDGIVIVDHGSRRAQSNAMLHEFVKMYKEKTGRLIVEAAHMELADPTISDAFDRCVEQGATRIIISPYFLFPGRHWDKDIPSIVAEAAKKHHNVPYLVTAPIGLHELMVTVINDRMEYCLSQVAGEVSECDMCDGTGRCQQSG